MVRRTKNKIGGKMRGNMTVGSTLNQLLLIQTLLKMKLHLEEH